MLFICKWPLHGNTLCKQTSHKMFSGSIIQTVLQISCVLTCLCSLPPVAINLLKTNIDWPLKLALFKIKHITQATFKINPLLRDIFDHLLIIHVRNHFPFYIWIPRLHNPALDIFFNIELQDLEKNSCLLLQLVWRGGKKKLKTKMPCVQINYIKYELYHFIGEKKALEEQTWFIC